MLPRTRADARRLLLVGRARNRKRQRRANSPELIGPTSPPAGPNTTRVGLTPALPPEVVKMLRRASRPEYVGEDGRLIGRPFVSALFNGSRYVAVGARVVKVAPETTFHEFLAALLVSDVLGNEWITAEQAKAPEARHQITRWLFELRALRQRSPVEISEGPLQVDMTGSALALLTLAYDVYALAHCAVLPSSLVARLKHPVEFQGAKYEIAVAALFARAGFTVEWVEDRTRKRPEFIATHKTTREQIAVEAKSRRRAGVLGRPGVAEVDTMKADLHRLLHEALEKETDGLPYAIYLDANLPVSDASAGTAPWISDVERMLNRRSASPTSPDPFASITVTNFSWHYSGEATVAARSESLLVLSLKPRVPLRDQRTIRLINEAAQQYGDVPGEFPED